MAEHPFSADSPASLEGQPPSQFEFLPFESSYRDNPFPFLAHARQEHPIFFSSAFQMWVVTRYEDVLTVLKNPEQYANQGAFSAPVHHTPEVRQLLARTMFGPASGGLLMSDPPRHTRLRRSLTTAFSARRVAQMEPAIRELALRLLEGLEPGAQMDFVSRFAHPLPVWVICRLIGVSDADRDLVRQGCDDFTDLLNLVLPGEEQLRRAHGVATLYQYMGELLEQRRQTPRDDLATALLQAVEQEQSKLSQEELVELLVSLLVAGFETTANFLSAHLLLLLTTGAWETIEPTSQHSTGLVEEGLRLATPVMGIFRKTVQPVHLGGVSLPANAPVYVLLASANRDERYVPHPEVMDWQRENLSRHLAFGYGIHFCMGAPLARLEAQVALEVLHRRFPRLRLGEDQPLTYTPGLLVRGLERLMIAWDEIG